MRPNDEMISRIVRNTVVTDMKRNTWFDLMGKKEKKRCATETSCRKGEPLGGGKSKRCAQGDMEALLSWPPSWEDASARERS